MTRRQNRAHVAVCLLMPVFTAAYFGVALPAVLNHFGG